MTSVADLLRKALRTATAERPGAVHLTVTGDTWLASAGEDTVTLPGHRVIWELLAGADLILAAGFDPVELISPWSIATPVMHLDTTPEPGGFWGASAPVRWSSRRASTRPSTRPSSSSFWSRRDPAPVPAPLNSPR